MAKLTPFPTGQELDNNGDPLSGGTVEFYEAGTSTPKTAYSSEDESVALANPFTLDSNGRGEIWLGSGAYKIVLKDSLGNLIDERDDVVGVALGEAVSYDVTTNTTITSVYNNSRIYANGALTLSLLSAIDAGDGFEFWVLNIGSSDVTIDPDLSETINDSATLTIVSDGWAKISCDGDEWYAYVNQPIKNNFVATAAPTVNDDSDDGYSVGSVWIDVTNDEAYRLLDATVGAAVWVNTTLSESEAQTIAQNAAQLPLNHISGLIVTNNSTDSEHDIDISIGECRNDDDSADYELTSALTKQLDAAFAEGNNAGGLGDTVSLPTSGTIHIFAITKDSDGTADVYADTSTSGANVPSGWSVVRRIHSLKTDGSDNIVGFNAVELSGGQVSVDWDVPSGGTANNPGTSAVLVTTNVPTGFQFLAKFSFHYSSGSGFVLLTSPDQTDSSPTSSGVFDLINAAGGTDNSTHKNVLTNTSAQVRYRVTVSGGGTNIYYSTHGYIDRRV